jgi:hypothetical protein
MIGLGGVFGSIAGGLLTNYDRPSLCFGIKALLALATAIQASRIDRSVEKCSEEELVYNSVCERSYINCRDTWRGLQRPTLYCIVIFGFIIASCIPDNTQFVYYYQVKVIGFSQT